MEMTTPALVYAPHPLIAGADRRLIYTPFKPGESIADYLARQELPLGNRPWALYLNDRPIPRSEWALTIPRAGDLITLRALVQGGGSGGSNPIRTLLTIALLVYAPYLAGALGGAAGGLTTFYATQGLVIVGGMMLIDRIAPIPQAKSPDARNDSSSPTFGFSGASNRARLFEPLPLLCGTHICYPDLGAKFYTEFHGKDQYIYAVMNFGLADVTLSEFRIGATPLSDFTDVETEESDGSGALTLFPANVDTVAGGTLTDAAGWITRTSSLDATALALDITGLLFYAGDSGLEARSAVFEMEYRAVGAGTWLPFASDLPNTHAVWSPNGVYSLGGNYRFSQPPPGARIQPSVFNGHQYELISAGTETDPENGQTLYKLSDRSGATEPTWPTGAGATVQDGELTWREAGVLSQSAVQITNATRTPVRLSYRRSVALGQYEVRVRRVSADETDSRATSELSFAQLRTYQPDNADYTGQKRVGLRIKASGQLQGAIEQFNAIAAARVPVWNGSSWVTQATSNPAWIFIWFARGKTIAARRVFGALLPDARLDIEAIKAWGAWCQTKGLTFNFVFDRPQNCREVLAIIARCGRATPTWASGKLGVVWDEANLPAVAVFGMSNIRRNTFQVEYLTGPVADEIVLEFINPDLDWQPDTVRVTVPGVTNPVRPAPVRLLGCTDKEMAGREANLLAAQQVYRRRQISWESDFEGMVAQRGDVSLLSHDLTQWDYSGRILAGDGTALTLERQVPFTNGAPPPQHYVGVVFPNGYYQIFTVAYQAGESAALALTEAWPTLDDLGNTLYTPDTDPNHPPHDYRFMFGPQATPGKKVKIVAVQPLSEHHVRLIATDEDPAYYAAETNPYNYVPPATYGTLAPAISDLQINDTLIRLGNGFATEITLDWDALGPYGEAVIRAAQNGAPLGDIGRTRDRSFSFQGPSAGALDLEVQLYGPTGESKPAGKATVTYEIVGKRHKPADVPWFLVDGRARLTWGAVPDVDLAGYRLRFHQGVNRDWHTATPLHDDLVTDNPWVPSSLPTGQITVLIKAVDSTENESKNAAYIVTDLGDPLTANVIETVDFKALGWPGDISGGAVSGGNLVANSNTLMWNAASGTAMWGDGVALMWQGGFDEMIYTCSYAVTSQLAGAQMTLEFMAQGEPRALYYRPLGPTLMWSADTAALMWLDDAALQWHIPEFTPWPGSVMAVPDTYEFRFTTGFGQVQGQISALDLIFDVPDIVERFNDVVVGGGGARLPIAETYRVIKNVNLTLQHDGGGAVSAKWLDKDAALGPLVKCFDASDTATAGVLDATIQGY